MSVHTVSLRISTCKNVPRVYFTKMILIVQFAAWFHLVQCIWISFLAWQRIQFGKNPAGSKGFSSSVAAVATLTFTAPLSRSSVAILRDLTQNSQHYLHAPSTQEMAHRDQYTSHLKQVSAKTRSHQLFLGRFFSALIMGPLGSHSYYNVHR